MLRVSCVLTVFYLLLCAFGSSVPLEDAATTTTITSADDATAATVAVPSTVASAENIGPKYLTATDDIPVCKQNNPDLGACVQRIFEIMMPRIKDGVKELNLPPLDPLELNRTSVQATFGPVTGRVTLKRALVYGLSTMKYKKVDVSMKDDKLRTIVKSYTPKVSVIGSYKADLSVNNAHMRPKGNFNVTITDVDMQTWSDSELYEKDGHRFVRLLDFDAEPKIGDMKINVTGIFEDPQLNEIVVNVLNQYWRDIYEAMLPQTRSYWAPLVLRALNEAMAVVPFDSYVKSK